MQLFGRKVLSVETLRRQGSAPYRAADDGAKQIIVYYNAVLRFAEVYDPSDWEGLSPTMIANALGAADEGIYGLEVGTARARCRVARLRFASSIASPATMAAAVA